MRFCKMEETEPDKCESLAQGHTVSGEGVYYQGKGGTGKDELYPTPTKGSLSEPSAGNLKKTVGQPTPHHTPFSAQSPLPPHPPQVPAPGSTFMA